MFDTFDGCRALTSLYIGDNVTSINEYAFSGCSGLTSVTIPNKVRFIGKFAFEGCSSLTSLTIPNSVTTIGSKAFYYCESLTSVTNLATTPQLIYVNTFSRYGTLHVYKGYKDAYKAADCWHDFTVVDDIEIKIPTTFKLDSTKIHIDAYKTYNIPTYTTDSPDYIIVNGFNLTSSNEDIVTVDDASGQFVGLTDGVATITVKVKDTDLTDSFTVYVGSAKPEDEPTPNVCATPVISVVNGKLHFDCETEGATFHYTATQGVNNLSGDVTDDVNITSNPTYTVTCYATKDGYKDSETVTKEVTLSAAGGSADVNADGKVDVNDVNVVISNIFTKP